MDLAGTGSSVFGLLAVSVQAQPFFDEAGALGWLTNSIFVAIVVVGLILGVTYRATRKMQLVPSGMQNFVEYVVEFLYSQTEEVVGKAIAPKVFPLLATIFIYVLIANWFGLLPFVGTIGFGHGTGPLTVEHIEVPLLRPPTADLNMTLGMALFFMVVWLFITMKEMGPIGFLVHTFGPKGGMTGIIGLLLIPIFLFVGVIEVVSIVLRPVSLSLRLFGNIYSGETLLHTMLHMGDALPAPFPMLMSITLPLPFYFFELLVGFLQAVVFALLCAVYIQLSTAHEEEEH